MKYQRNIRGVNIPEDYCRISKQRISDVIGATRAENIRAKKSYWSGIGSHRNKEKP